MARSLPPHYSQGRDPLNRKRTRAARSGGCGARSSIRASGVSLCQRRRRRRGIRRRSARLPLGAQVDSAVRWKDSEVKRGCAMSQADFWYVRFPDGRILRAASTAILRRNWTPDTSRWAARCGGRRVTNGCHWHGRRSSPTSSSSVPPLRSRTRSRKRVAASPSPAPPRRVPHRINPPRLARAWTRRGCTWLACAYLDELLAALDSTLIAKKLLLGLAAGVVLGGLLALEARLLVRARK